LFVGLFRMNLANAERQGRLVGGKVARDELGKAISASAELIRRHAKIFVQSAKRGEELMSK